jgi:hypothetical protein
MPPVGLKPEIPADERPQSHRPRGHWDRSHSGHLFCLTLHKHRLTCLLQFLDSLLAKKLSLAFLALFVLSAPASYSSNIQTNAAVAHSTTCILGFGVSPRRRTMSSRRFGKRCSCCLQDELLTGTLPRGKGGKGGGKRWTVTSAHSSHIYVKTTSITHRLIHPHDINCNIYANVIPSSVLTPRDDPSGFVKFRHVYFASCVSLHIH